MQTKKVTGVRVPCLRCGEASASVALNLACLGDEEAVACHECDGTFSLKEVREVIGRWTALLAWIDGVPQFPDGE